MVCAIAGIGGAIEKIGKQVMAGAQVFDPPVWRLIVVGGQQRNIGKTQLVCDIILAFPKVNWIAGKISDDHHPSQESCSFVWESQPVTGTDCARFLAAGATKSFRLDFNKGSLAECLPLLRRVFAESPSGSHDLRKKVIVVESNSLSQFVKPSLFFAVIDPDREDFNESTQVALTRANALVLRASGGPVPVAPPAPLWLKVPAKLLQERPSVLQRSDEPLPRPLESLVYKMLDDPPSVSL